MNVQRRDVDKFYGRIRSHLKDGQRQMDLLKEEGLIRINKKQDLLICNDGIRDDKMFGKITKEDFLKILASYDKQQANPDLMNKPVTCKALAGCNFEKLLYLKHGFHNTGSTDYLVNKLQIDDVSRISLLGGYSDYNLFKDEDILTITRLHNRILIRDYLDKAWSYLDAKKEPHLILQLINKARELDPNFGDTIGCNAKFEHLNNRIDKAIQEYELALNNETLENTERVLNGYIDCLYNEGIRLFTKNKLVEAKEMFKKILNKKKNHEGSNLHVGLCDNKISQQLLIEKRPPTYRK